MCAPSGVFQVLLLSLKKPGLQTTAIPQFLSSPTLKPSPVRILSLHQSASPEEMEMAALN